MVDYDIDGDIDLFIGSGPASGSPARDFIYRNFRQEYSVPFYLDRIDTGIIGTDLVDGQNWNWIDYDNDGDLDAFLTNYSQNVLNRLYRCDDPHYYVKMTAAQVGTIVSDPGFYLSNTWGDFDNDGDIDCFLTRDASQTSRYYTNNGNGTYKIDTIAFTQPPVQYTSFVVMIMTHLDLCIRNQQFKRALQNETQNGNKWIIYGVFSGPTTIFPIICPGNYCKNKGNNNSIPVWQLEKQCTKQL
jgi:hypothetical protein